MVTGPLLMFWPYAWGTLLSTYQKHIEPSTLVRQLSLYFLGSLIVHSAGCTWNDIIDKDFDAKFERTKRRPLPSGTMSLSTAIIFFLCQYIIIFSLLTLLDESAAKLALVELLIILPIYPYMKRITRWSQMWVGLGMNWGIIVAWVNNVGQIDVVLLSVLLFGSWCWTMYYDTILLVQDRKYAFKTDMNPNAFLLNKITRLLLSVFCAGFVTSLLFAGIWSNSRLMYYILTVGGTAAYLTWQYITLNLEDPVSCITCFDLNSKHLGVIVLSGMLVEYIEKDLYLN